MNDTVAVIEDGYEFGSEENAIISRTASRARSWGTILIVGGLITLLASGLDPAAGFDQFGEWLNGVVLLVVGAFFTRAGRSFAEVVDTEGDDVAHMLDAVRAIGTAFGVQIAAIILLILAAVLFGTLAAA